MPYGISFTINLDIFIQQWLQTRSIPWLVKVLGMITNLGSPAAFMMISVFVFIVLGWRKKWLEALFSYSCLISSWVLMSYLKDIFARPRPLGESLTIATGFSFPSGHAMLSMAYYGFLALIIFKHYPTKWRIILISFSILILLIGFSRIYLNVHYTSDVLAGYIFGALILGLNWAVMKFIAKHN